MACFVNRLRVTSGKRFIWLMISEKSITNCIFACVLVLLPLPQGIRNLPYKILLPLN